jgi:hypothetical protein
MQLIDVDRAGGAHELEPTVARGALRQSRDEVEQHDRAAVEVPHERHHLLGPRRRAGRPLRNHVDLDELRAGVPAHQVVVVDADRSEDAAALGGIAEPGAVPATGAEGLLLRRPATVRPYEAHAAERPAAHDALGVFVGHRKPLGEADHDLPLVTRRQVADRVRVAQVVRDRLLTEDVLVALGCLAHDLEVEVRGQRDDDSLDGVIIEQRPVVGVAARATRAGNLLDRAGIGVADRDELCLRHHGDRLGVELAHPAQADDPNADRSHPHPPLRPAASEVDRPTAVGGGTGCPRQRQRRPAIGRRGLGPAAARQALDEVHLRALERALDA